MRRRLRAAKLHCLFCLPPRHRNFGIFVLEAKLLSIFLGISLLGTFRAALPISENFLYQILDCNSGSTFPVISADFLSKDFRHKLCLIPPRNLHFSLSSFGRKSVDFLPTPLALFEVAFSRFYSLSFLSASSREFYQQRRTTMAQISVKLTIDANFR